jgi:Zn-dependent M28 family amino/carboxypeptidase
VLAPYPLGVEWAGTAGLRMHMVADAFRQVATTFNVLAETPGGRADNVVMVGAHLDSVSAGPGINDNGSGSAAILEVALQMQNVKPRNKVRFAWWGAEEAVLIGSDHYVFSLSEEEVARIALYLNFDMVGSPNFVRFVYDGDGSQFGLAGPPGSEAIEALFEDFYASRGLAFEPTQIDFRSDYAAFFDVGIPFGGLFTGAEGIKTAAQTEIYGGTAGQQYDPCYHLACDTADNVSLEVLDLNSDAIAYSVLQYAMNTQAVNGKKGKGNFKPDAGAAPSPERRGHMLIR